MTVGPLVCAVAGLLMLRIGPDAAYLTDVLPAAAVLGLGLTILVAPLTATVLAAVESRQAGIASGVNNAVARAAGLMAVAALPVLAGITGDDYTDPSAFADGFRIAIWIAIGLLVVGAGLAAATISNDVLAADVAAARQRAVPPARHCAVEGPPLTARVDARVG